MSEKVTASIIHSYILSRLDYGNALLINANSDQIVKLQRVQNAAARILCKTSKFTHITPVLKQTSLVARCGEDKIQDFVANMENCSWFCSSLF